MYLVKAQTPQANHTLQRTGGQRCFTLGGSVSGWGGAAPAAERER